MVKPYNCNVCNKQFTARGDLVKHQRVHSKEKSYQCGGKLFTQNGYLVSQKRIHNAEKLYQCDIYAKEFVRKVHLSQHQITTVKKLYICDEQPYQATKVSQQREVIPL